MITHDDDLPDDDGDDILGEDIQKLLDDTVPSDEEVRDLLADLDRDADADPLYTPDGIDMPESMLAACVVAAVREATESIHEELTELRKKCNAQSRRITRLERQLG